MDILINYLDSIKDMSESTKEQTYRGELKKLIESFKTQENIEIIHEPNNDKSGLGAPDYWIRKNGLSLGYIENKRINYDLDKVAKSEQIAKYMILSDNIILCDYLRFILLDSSAYSDDISKVISKKDSINLKNYIKAEVRICKLENLKDYKNLPLDSIFQDLRNLFNLFFTHKPKPINTAWEFANALALRTHYVKQELITLHSSHKDDAINKTFLTYKKELYADLPFSIFADSFAQTLTYVLFLAKLNNKANEKIDLYNTEKFVPQNFPLLQELSGFLSKLNRLDSIHWLISEILYIINHINIESILKEFMKGKQKDLFNEYLYKDPVIHFYETFFKEYDFALKKDKGVYYTPKPVVNFIINAIDTSLKNDFKKTQGLKNALDSKDITLLDFATGTGTFLIESFDKALQDSNKYDANFKSNVKNLIDNFYGFEYLIAPYTIAHINLYYFLQQKGYSFGSKDERLNIFLTDTLYKPEGLFEEFGSPLIKEKNQATKIKQNPILIITGNPPYNANSKSAYKVESYKYCGLDKDNNLIHIDEKSPSLNDDYIKFIHFAQDKMDNQDNGILAIITNNSFLDGVTMNGMRWSLLNTFDKIYILNLHGDNDRDKDKINDKNVFNIRQGVCISIFIKLKNKQISNTPKCKVYYYDLIGSKQSKYKALYESSLKNTNWQILKPKAPYYLFIPQDKTLAKNYKNNWSLKDIFRICHSGIASGCDNFVYSTSDSIESLENFKDKIKDFIDTSKDYSKQYFGITSKNYDIKKAQEIIKSTNNDENNYKKVLYRPFDYRYTYYTKEMGFIFRPRYKVMQYLIDSNITSLVYDRGTKLQEINNIFISNKMIDHHLVGSGSYISPLYIKEDLESKSILKENFTPNFRAFIDSKYDTHFSPEQILGYIYAVLFHKGYKEKYIDFLKQDFPKVHFVESKETFLKLSKLGSKIIGLHLLDSNMLNEINNEIGKGKYKRDKEQNPLILKAKYNAVTKRLWVNESLYFENIESSVWTYKIGGYSVLDKYLKSHKNEKLDSKHFQNIIKALHKTLELESKIAEIMLE